MGYTKSYLDPQRSDYQEAHIYIPGLCRNPKKEPNLKKNK